MGYCSSHPMDGDLPRDIQWNTEEWIMLLLNEDLLHKRVEDLKIGENFIKLYDEFKCWLKEISISNEFELLKVIDSMLYDFKTNKDDIYFYDNIYETTLFVLPLSFLENGVKINPSCELSKLLLRMLKKSDGGSKERGYKKSENLYPNGIATPNDYIKTYIKYWNKLISGEMKYKDIKATVETEILSPYMLNTK